MEFRLAKVASLVTGLQITTDGGKVKYANDPFTTLNGNNVSYVYNDVDDVIENYDVAIGLLNTGSSQHTWFQIEERQYKVSYITLPIILKLKTKEIGSMTYFGQFGVDASSLDDNTGWLSLNGVRLVTEADKSLMRQPIWALWFAIAGMDALVQSVQVVHAISRLDRFYFKPTQTLQGFTLSQILSSEFAVALLLDHHVNRPSHVIPCVADAIARSGLTPAQVAQSSTDNEALIIQNYLTLRETFGGTSAMTRRLIPAVLLALATIIGACSDQRAANLPAFTDHLVHPTINVDRLDPECALPNLVLGTARKVDKVETILNNSFGMVGINSVIIVKKYVAT